LLCFDYQLYCIDSNSPIGIAISLRLYPHKTTVQRLKAVSLHFRPIQESFTEIWPLTWFTLVYVTAVTCCGVNLKFNSPKLYRSKKCFAHTLQGKILYVLCATEFFFESDWL